ncbi:MAG: ATP-dependent Clp protease ATP-binding subunit ClpC, partial [Calditrichaeota bacterium]|nr:ATP-dependent Clp protease ATP-binding subunit ClpC [Calditrichota bacterium]
ENASDIADIYIKEVQERLAEQNVTLNISEEVKEEILNDGFSTETGARTLQRTVESIIEDKLAERMLKGKINSGSKVTASMQRNKVVFNVASAVTAQEEIE